MRSHQIHIHIVHTIGTHPIQFTRHQGKPGSHITNNRITSHSMSLATQIIPSPTRHAIPYKSSHPESTHKAHIHKSHPYSHRNATTIQASHHNEVNNTVPSCHQTTTIPRIQAIIRSQANASNCHTNIKPTHCSTSNKNAYNTDPFHSSNNHNTPQTIKAETKENSMNSRLIHPWSVDCLVPSVDWYTPVSRLILSQPNPVASLTRTVDC